MGSWSTQVYSLTHPLTRMVLTRQPTCLIISMNRIFLLLIFSALLGASSSAQPQGAKYEVYALSYGVYPNFPVSGLIAGADKTRKIDLQMMVWLVRGGG